MSLKAGTEGSAAGPPCLGFFEREKPVVGAVGMWESRSDLQGLWEGRETWVWFSSLSIARHFHSPPRFHHALCLRCRRANSLRLASRISVAAWVSDFAAAAFCN